MHQGKFSRALSIAVMTFVTMLLGTALAAPAHAGLIDDYARYQPQRNCAHHDKPGAVALATWLTARGGGWGAISRPCSGGTSEHAEGRAFDWVLSAKNPADVALVDATLAELFAPDLEGNPHALAREMGIMYIIWNDRCTRRTTPSWPSATRARRAASSRKCSPTLRHRDHVHFSLSRQGGRALTSFYLTAPAG